VLTADEWVGDAGTHSEGVTFNLKTASVARATSLVIVLDQVDPTNGTETFSHFPDRAFSLFLEAHVCGASPHLMFLRRRRTFGPR